MLPIAILAGGLATRLRPATQHTPKSLLPVAGEPFIAHQLRLLRARGITRVVLCLGYLAEMVRDFVGDGSRFGLDVDYSFDGPALLGTAGALKRARDRLGESFLVMYGDSYLVCDYAAVARAFRDSGKRALMTVFRNEGRWDTSNVEFRAGEILAYSKQDRTPRMEFIDYGLGVFRSDAIDLVPADRQYDLAALYGELLRRGELAGFEVQERFYEIGSPAGLKETEQFITAHRVSHA